MTSTPTLSVVIPVYNEEMNIGKLYQRLQNSLKPLNIDWEVVYINDGSKDNSLEKLVEIQKKDNRYKIIIPDNVL